MGTDASQGQVWRQEELEISFLLTHIKAIKEDTVLHLSSLCRHASLPITSALLDSRLPGSSNFHCTSASTAKAHHLPLSIRRACRQPLRFYCACICHGFTNLVPASEHSDLPSNMDGPVAVVGGSGKVAQQCVKQLVAKDHKVVAVGRDASKLEELFGPSPLVKCVSADVEKPETLKAAFQGVSGVINASSGYANIHFRQKSFER